MSVAIWNTVRVYGLECVVDVFLEQLECQMPQWLVNEIGRVSRFGGINYDPTRDVLTIASYFDGLDLQLEIETYDEQCGYYEVGVNCRTSTVTSTPRIDCSVSLEDLSMDDYLDAVRRGVVCGITGEVVE